MLVDGKHTIEVCARACERLFAVVMYTLLKQDILLESILIKPNMILPGSESKETKIPQEIAWYTVRTLSRTFASAVPGLFSYLVVNLKKALLNI